MFGFSKKRDTAPEVHDTDETDPEDLERATWIQQKGQVGAMFANRLDDPDEDRPKQRQHYENVRDELLGVLDGIENEFCRGFASHQLIKMCLPAKDVAVCRALLAGVRDPFLRERILEDFPLLAPDGRDWRTGQ